MKAFKGKRIFESYIKNPKNILIGILNHSNSLWPDKLYLKILYRLKLGHKLDLKNPQTFTEKIQWLKLYDRKDEYTHLVDKAAVKDIVGRKMGFKYIIPTIGEWNNVEEIEWEKLPNQFVLKTTHGGGSGGVVICKDKKSFNREVAKKKLKNSLKNCIYKSFREWPYKNVPRKIIAEKFISLGKNKDLADYKIFCFNGEPKFIEVDFDRFVNHKRNLYDIDWNLLPFEMAFDSQEDKEIPKPHNLKELLDIARTLADNKKLVRVDLYIIENNIYFGETTFYPDGGFGRFNPPKYDEIIGKMLNLDSGVNSNSSEFQPTDGGG